MIEHTTHGNLTWGAEQDAKLIEMKRAGLSPTAIGAKMDMTKGKIAGRVFRLQQKGILTRLARAVKPQPAIAPTLGD